MAQFFGHTHKDEFEIFYDVETYTRATNVVYVGGSVTTYSQINPSYRMYTVDGSYNGASWVSVVAGQEFAVEAITQARLVEFRHSHNTAYHTRGRFMNQQSIISNDVDVKGFSRLHVTPTQLFQKSSVE